MMIYGDMIHDSNTGLVHPIYCSSGEAGAMSSYKLYQG